MNQSAYIFDVDGVLNNLRVYEPDQRILAHIAKLLQGGTFVAINTGRGYEWVEQQVIQGIRRHLPDPQPMDHLFAAVEMGGIGVEFPGGNEQKIPSAFSLSPEHIATVRQVLDQHPEYHDRIGWYAKDSMATLDKVSSTPLEDFKPVQKALTDTLREIFKNQHVKVANSTDAIDVHAPEAGKWAGAQLIYDWLRRVSNVQHERFVCFGDSIVDYDMARFFASQSHDTVFVFSGLKFETDTPDPGVKLIKTTQPYHDGVNEYLQSLGD